MNVSHVLCRERRCRENNPLKHCWEEYVVNGHAASTTSFNVLISSYAIYVIDWYGTRPKVVTKLFLFKYLTIGIFANM